MSNDEPTIDVQKLLRQQLISLARAGVTDLAVGAGEYEFTFEDSSTDNEQATDSNDDSAGKTKPVPQPSSTSQSQTATSSGSSQATANNPLPPKAELSPQPIASPPKVAAISSDVPYSAAIPADQRADALAVLNTKVQSCTQCPELCGHRKQTVFGVGSPNTRLVLIGEGPGADEDRVGIPFVGAAGKLLDKILVASKLQRDEIYILNTVKCRPPGNRNPSDDELANCWSYAEQQLEILQPEFILCLGSVASKTLLKTTQSLGRMRQKLHQYRSSQVIVTYHPAYLLRNEGAKRHVWDDMKMLMKEMGVDLSKDK